MCGNVRRSAGKLTGLLGRQPELPDWVYDGVTLGIRGGTEVCQQKLDTMRNGGVKVNGIWAQDWSGIRMTSFGKRVMWNWKWNSALYPQLDTRIAQWKEEGVQFSPISTRTSPAIKISAKRPRNAAI